MFGRIFRKRFVIWLNTNGKLKIVLSTLVVALMLFMFTYEFPTSKTWTYWTMPLSGKIVALDAGHGGPDGGARSADGGVIEKDINLAIALFLRDYLQQSGALVVMTREGDNDLASPGTKGLSKRKTEDLLARVDFIQKQKADLAVSIHLNAIPSPRWRGAQTFFHIDNKEGKLFADLIQEELRVSLGNTDREAITNNGKYLLKALKIPTALVEVGFLSNPEEARLLADETYQKKLAEAIYRGILRYASGERPKQENG